MRVHRRYLPQEIIDEYGLTDDYFDSNGYIYVEIREGMYTVPRPVGFHKCKGKF
jgi:hypothetical protein